MNKKLMIQKQTLRLLAVILAVGLLFTGCSKIGGEDSSSASSSEPQSSMEPSSQEISSEPSSLPDSGNSSGGPETSSEPLISEEIPAAVIPIDAEGMALPDFSVYDNETVTWGPGHQMDKLNRSTACLQLQEKYEEHGGLFIYPTEEKKMYLTFDEGYENGYTSKILDVLKEKECPAVFFVTLPYVKQNPELIRRMIDEGHVVGNHSSAHPEKGMPSFSTEQIVEDIAKIHNYVAENFDYQMTWFRPPAGLFSTRSLEVLKELGYTSVLWSFAYYDYDVNKQPDPDEALKKLEDMAHPGGIPLLHAVSQTNTQILGQAIDAWREAGYELCKMS